MKKTPGQSMTSPFKRCSMCGVEWATKDAFLSDHQVRLDGYLWTQSMHKATYPARGVLIFTHRHHACRTSLAIAAEKFRDHVHPRKRRASRP
jgi:hypothetical protein